MMLAHVYLFLMTFDDACAFGALMPRNPVVVCMSGVYIHRFVA